MLIIKSLLILIFYSFFSASKNYFSNMSRYKIRNVHAWQIWDACGQITIEIEVTLRYGSFGRAIAPLPFLEYSQQLNHKVTCSKNKIEHAVEFVCTEINALLKGTLSNDQEKVDDLLISLLAINDTNQFTKNLIATASIANLKAVTAAEQMPLWQYMSEILNEGAGDTLPLPDIQISMIFEKFRIPNKLPVFGLIPIGASSFVDALLNFSKVMCKLTELKESFKLDGLNDFLHLITSSIEQAGFTPGLDIAISLQVRKLNNTGPNSYLLPNIASPLTSDEMCGQLVDCIEQFPVISIQDPFTPADVDAWMKFHWAAARKIQIVKSTSQDTNEPHNKTNNFPIFYNACAYSLDQALTITEMRKLVAKAKLNETSLILQPDLSNHHADLLVQLGVGFGLTQIKLKSVTAGNEGIRISHAMKSLSKLNLNKSGRLTNKTNFPWMR